MYVSPDNFSTKVVYLMFMINIACFSIKGLTPMEEMLIISVILMMLMHRLPHGLLGYNGHVLCNNKYWRNWRFSEMAKF